MDRIAMATGLLLFSLISLAAEPIPGKVVGITDGDTLTVLTAQKRQVKVRLSEIDTPERGQPYASRAMQVLSELAFQKQVRVIPETTDRYGRTVGRVIVGDTDVNARMVASGAAWVYREYANREMLFDLENQAREAERGLWSLPESDRVPPWKWRALKREGKSVQQAARESADRKKAKSTFQCGTKRYCGDMTSCEEARFFLTTCGVSPLDRDNDGVPCESICR